LIGKVASDKFYMATTPRIARTVRHPTFNLRCLLCWKPWGHIFTTSKTTGNAQLLGVRSYLENQSKRKPVGHV
jgi:hypothetical protein